MLNLVVNKTSSLLLVNNHVRHCALLKSVNIIRRRTSSTNKEKELKANSKHRGPIKPIPVLDVRRDGVDHHERKQK